MLHHQNWELLVCCILMHWFSLDHKLYVTKVKIALKKKINCLKLALMIKDLLKIIYPSSCRNKYMPDSERD